MKGPTHNRFHFLSISWLRDVMNVEMNTLPTNKVAEPDDPERARIHGHVLPEGYGSRLGYVALMLLIVAATGAIATARPGLGEALRHGLQIGALGLTALALLLLVVDNVRERRRGHHIDIVIQGSSSESGVVDAAQLAGWLANAQGQLWIVSEHGFTREALADAHARGGRCFIKTRGGFEELATTDVVATTHRIAA